MESNVAETKFNPDKARRKLFAEVRKLIGQGLSDSEILEYLRLKPNVLAEYKNKILEFDRSAFESMDRVTAYSDYLLKIHQIVKELQGAITVCSEKGQGQALVNAIWRKKEAYDSALKWGQEFGFIEKQMSELKVSSEFSLNTMSQQEVEEQIAKEVKKMNKMIKTTHEIRPEVLEFVPEEVKEKIPANVLSIPKKVKEKSTAKVKLVMRKRV